MTTVSQLIESLKSFPPETRVVVPGYEGGYDDADLDPELFYLDLYVNNKEDTWYYGCHEQSKTPETGTPAVLIQ